MSGLAESQVFAAEELTVLDVRCAAAVGRADEEVCADVEVVLPLVGAFRRRAAGGEAVIDASSGYVTAPVAEHEIVHTSAGDRCVAILLSERLADEMALDAAWAAGRWMLRRPPSHIAVLASAWRSRRSGDRLAAEEAWLRTVAGLLPVPVWAPDVAPGVAMQRRAVAAVREAIAVEPGAPWTMRRLGDVAGYAPHHLSRVFTRHTAMTLTEYRDRIRLGAAMSLLGDGLPISTVAARLGFADHSHLTRRARALLGMVPSQLRFTAS